LTLRIVALILLVLCIVSALTYEFVLPTTKAAPNLVQNGGFNNGLNNWTFTKVTTWSGSLGEFPETRTTTDIGNCTPPERLGNPFLEITAPYGADGYLEQGVYVPLAETQLSLLVFGLEGYNPQISASGLVTVTISVVDAEYKVIDLRTFNPPAMLIPGGGVTADKCTGNTPIVLSFSLSQFSGQQVRLRLRVKSDSCCGASAFFDDVTIPGASWVSEVPLQIFRWTIGNLPNLALTLSVSANLFFMFRYLNRRWKQMKKVQTVRWQSLMSRFRRLVSRLRSHGRASP